MSTNTILACVQATHVANNDAVARFRQQLDYNDELIQNGQFGWARFYRTELRTWVEDQLTDFQLRKDLLNTEVTAKTKKKTETYESYVSGMGSTAGEREEGAFEQLRTGAIAKVNERLKDDPANADGKWMMTLLTSPESQGTTAYDACNVSMQNGLLVAPARPSPPAQSGEATDAYKDIFKRETGKLGFRGMKRIYLKAAEGCYAVADSVGKYLHEVGGMQMCKAQGKAPALTHVIYKDNAINEQGPSPNYYTLMRYNNSVKKASDESMTVIDANFAIVTGVISGTHIGQGFKKSNPPLAVPVLSNGNKKPDHYMLIISFDTSAYPFDSVEYLFWDPDPVSKKRSLGFGLIYYVGGKDAGPHNSKGDVHEFGRFTTALEYEHLKAREDDGAMAYDGDKRYQAVTLQAT